MTARSMCLRAARGGFSGRLRGLGFSRAALLSAVLLGAMLVAPSAVLAQDPQGPGMAGGGEGAGLVDRVVAVAGDSIILLTEIEEQLLRMEASGATLPEDEAQMDQLRREVLESLVNQQLLLQAAASDSTIAVPTDRLDRAVEQNLQERIRSFGSEAELQRALAEQGQTLTSFRASIEDEIRRQILISQYFERQRQSARVAPVSEAEIREFYESQRGRLDSRPATVTFRQILLQPEPSDSAKSAAREEAERILEMLRSGEDFEDLARRFSQDPGSRSEGGDLGWFRRGTMVEEFEDVAFSLQEGGTSGVVETMYGSHIIKVERVRGSERRVRHILIQAEVDQADMARTEALAEEIRERIEAGESMQALSREFPPATSAVPDSLSVPLDQLDGLPSPYSVLASAEPEQAIGPIVFGPEGREIVAVLKILEVRQEGDFTYEDLRGQIEDRLRDQRLEERVIRTLRERAYIDIRIE